MRLPNGFGSVYKLSGNRRNPYVAKKTKGWETNPQTGKVKQLYTVIGYYPTRKEALTALANYNENPYDLNTEQITFSDVYEKWSDEYFPTLSSKSSIRTITAAYKYCEPLYNMRMQDIRVIHLEKTILNAKVGDTTKMRIKSIFNLMYKYALKHDIVQKNYAELCDNIKKPKPTIIRTPFSEEEISLLWEHIEFPFVDMLLIGIYSGWRPQELAILKISDINLNNLTFTGGLKTEAGKNRIVPIHPIILPLVKKNYEKALSMKSNYLFNDEDGQQGTALTYDKYRGRWKKIMKRLNLDHKPHDTRHTFITKAKEANMNEYILKLIVGHAIYDITEETYTHQTIEDLHKEIQKIKG